MASHKYIRNVLAAVRRADRDFSLIDEGDKILIGLSGGKDSMALTYALSLYGKFAQKKFIIQPVYLDLGFPGGGNVDHLKDFCNRIGLNLIVNDSTFVYQVLLSHQGNKAHLPCSICSRMKKAAMNSVAKELNFHKVAFAHHSDDAVETLFMNMIHGGRVATFEPKMHLERSNMDFVRPLIYCKESDLANMCIEEGFDVRPSACPADKHTDRESIKNILKDLYHTYPESYENFKKSLTNYDYFKLFFDNIEYESEDNHSYALKPVLTADDIRGTSLANKKKKEGEVDFLILHKHKCVGEISYRFISDHKAEIFNLKGDDEVLEIAINQLSFRLSRVINPITIYLLGGKKSLKEKCGFTLTKEPTSSKERYLKKIKL